MSNMTIEQRLAVLTAIPVVKSGHRLMTELAAKLAADSSYDLAKAEQLLATVGRTHGLGASDDAQAARYAELSSVASPYSRRASGDTLAAKPALPQLTGDPARDARIIELSFAAKAVSIGRYSRS